MSKSRFLPAMMVSAAVVAAFTLGVNSAAAQQERPTPPQTVPAKSSVASNSAGSSTWDETKAMTRKEWTAAKRKWALEKVKWRECNRQSSDKRLSAPKSWSFIASCMNGV